MVSKDNPFNFPVGNERRRRHLGRVHQIPRRGSAADVNRAMSQLCWLLDYELAAASRFRRFASLAMFTPVKNVNLAALFSDCIRDCDELFELDDSTVILMGETDKSGANAVIGRIMNQYQHEMKLECVVVSYPNDGKEAMSLLTKAYNELHLSDRG